MKTKSFISFILLLLISLPTYAYDVPELSLGIRLGGEAHLSMAPLFAKEENGGSVLHAVYPFGVGGNLGIGLTFDVKTRSWFSVSAQTTMGVARNVTDKESGVQAMWQDFNFDLLAKIHVKWWFIGAGPGFSLSTPAVYRTKNNHLNSNIGDLGDNLNDLGLRPRISTRFTTTIETGLNIPLISNKMEMGYISVSFRSVIAPVTIDKLLSMMGVESEEVQLHYLCLLGNKASTVFSSGIFVGFNYIFN